MSEYGLLCFSPSWPYWGGRGAVLGSAKGLNGAKQRALAHGALGRGGMNFLSGE